MKKTKGYYIVKMNSRPRFPYIAVVQAKSQTAAKQLFIDWLTDNEYEFAKKTPGAYTALEVDKKRAMTHGIPALGFERAMFEGKKRR